MGPSNLSPLLLFLLKNASKILSVIREKSPWGGVSGTEIKPKVRAKFIGQKVTSTSLSLVIVRQLPASSFILARAEGLE